MEVTNEKNFFPSLKRVVLPGTLRPYFPVLQKRLGTSHDGGYIVPIEVLAECDLLLSFGINLDWRFELESLKAFPNLKISTFDKTTNWKRILFWSLTRFLASPITGVNRHRNAWKMPFKSYRFLRESRIKHRALFVGPSDSSGCVSVDSVINQLKGIEKIFVKMDIEGAEYAIIDDLIRHKNVVLGYALEFHEVFKSDRFQESLSLLQNDYYVTHVHVNNVASIGTVGNPDFIEVTLVRKDYLPDAVMFQEKTYRHPEDAPNNPFLPELIVEFSD